MLETTSVPQEAEGLQGPTPEHIEVFYLRHADVMTVLIVLDIRNE